MRRTIGTVLAVAGALLLLEAAVTLAWREPVSWLTSRGEAQELDRRLDALDAGFSRTLASSLPRDLTAERRMALAARALERRARPGDPLGRISIPDIGARFVIVQGAAAEDLKAGPGHYLQTALPGERGTVGLAGHRTTYQQPFRRIDELRRGDEITLTMPYGRFTYRVQRTRIVAPSQVGVLDRVRSGERLVLTACHPLFSAAERIVVTAALHRAAPRGAAV